MTTSIQQLIDTYKKDLPSYHQEALSSFDWVSICHEIAAKHQLSGRQGEMFVGEVVMMLYQITLPDLFKINLMNHVGVSEAAAHTIILDVKSRILDRLQTELERVVGEAPQYMQEQLTKAGISDEVAAEMAVTANKPEYISTGPVNDQKVVDPYHEEID